MAWAVGDDIHGRRRFIGYGVPARCDYPGCDAQINRGIAHACGGDDFGNWCGLHFCGSHLEQVRGGTHDGARLCARCAADQAPFEPTPEDPEWARFLLTDESWGLWRSQNPDWVLQLLRQVA